MIGAIRSVAGLSGHNFAALLSQADQESGLDVKARNRKSTATGPFQFIERTWLDLVRRHGSAFGLGDTADKITVVKGAADGSRSGAAQADPGAAGRSQYFGGHGRPVSQRRQGAAGKDAGRPASAIEGRIAYIMGPSGAARLISAAEKTPGAAARDMLPSAAAANRNLFHDKRGHALSAVGSRQPADQAHGGGRGAGSPRWKTMRPIPSTRRPIPTRCCSPNQTMTGWMTAADEAWDDDDLFSKPAGEPAEEPRSPGRHRV